MASPYAAGLCALLISDIIADKPEAKVRSCDVKRALTLSASPVPGFTPLDYGHGLPNAPKAAALLRKLVKSTRNDPIIGYEISTACPHGYKGRAPAAYWRSTWFPKDERQTFSIGRYSPRALTPRFRRHLPASSNSDRRRTGARFPRKPFTSEVRKKPMFSWNTTRAS